ncbi:MAG: hypothetical protein HPY44_20175 [Armatimonadetes bacterium]|nr:hypothetical protein [Armatimonadota bacterium]
MGCLKGKKTAPEKPGNYKCSKCGATAKSKGDLCKPEKIKDAKKKKKDK